MQPEEPQELPATDSQMFESILANQIGTKAGVKRQEEENMKEHTYTPILTLTPRALTRPEVAHAHTLTRLSRQKQPEEPQELPATDSQVFASILANQIGTKAGARRQEEEKKKEAEMFEKLLDRKLDAMAAKRSPLRILALKQYGVTVTSKLLLRHRNRRVSVGASVNVWMGARGWTFAVQQNSDQGLSGKFVCGFACVSVRKLDAMAAKRSPLRDLALKQYGVTVTSKLLLRHRNRRVRVCT